MTLRARSLRTIFISNNPAHAREEYANKLTRLGVPTPVEDILIMTGDRLETAVLMEQETGMSTALTLTGATSESDLAGSSIRPSYVIRPLGELQP